MVPVGSMAQAEAAASVLYSPSHTRDIFEQAGLACEEAQVGDPEAAVNYLSALRPDALVTGRTRYLSAERLLIQAARGMGIRTALVLDEWYNYRLPFADEHDALSYLPDFVCCQDEQARREANGEGIPPGVLVVTGCPALERLAETIEDFRDSPPDRPSYFTGDQSTPVIVFLSKTHAVDYGEEPGAHGSLGPYLWYTEYSVRRELARVVNDIDRPCTLVEKLYPSAEEPPLISVDSLRVNWLTVGRTPLWPMLWHSDLVVGMRSMALLEASLMGWGGVSYQPGLYVPYVCTAVRLGLIERLDDRNALAGWLAGNWRRDSTNDGPPNARPQFARPDAARRVLDVLFGG